MWIIGDKEYCEGLGLKPLGLEPVAVGLSSDAEHIITPSKDGPQLAIHGAMRAAEVTPEDIATWDLHATATPGDYQEVKNLREILPECMLISARKGTFGHGMGPCGGWELTAQYMGVSQGMVYPTALERNEAACGVVATASKLRVRQRRRGFWSLRRQVEYGGGGS